jgi:acyl-CoA thioesterase-1
MRSLGLFALLALAGCGSSDRPRANQPAASAPSAAAPAPAKPADSRPAIVVFGDSISAGFGLDAGQSYPDLLQRDLDRRGIAYRVVNMGVSGDTTQDGVARISLALAEKPAIALLELGGNDGLRGIPISITRRNLASMIEDFQKAGARVVLAGMTLPPNYGPDYIGKFDAVYRDLAAQYKVTLIPFLLEGVGGDPRFMQHDGLHPNAEGARKVEALVMKALEPLLRR